MRIRVGHPDVFTNLLIERYSLPNLPTVSGIATDSREVEPGDLYLPIVGDRVNGHNFAAQVSAAGASLIVASEELPTLPDSTAVARVDDTVKEIGLLAKKWRKIYSTKLIGITGSNGKTTTKNLAAAMLSRNHNLLYTDRSYNSKVGLPMTLLQITGDNDLVLVELGTNQPGEIAYLADIAKPSVALVTNVSASHISALIDERGVAEEKSAIYQALSDQGISVVNDADEYVALMPTQGQRFTYCLDPAADQAVNLGGNYVESDSGASLKIKSLRIEIELPLVGRHMAQNALAAASLGFLHQVSPADIKASIENFEVPSGRGQICKVGDITLINDTYNANPSSTLAGLAMLSGYPGTHHRRIAVLGDMLELGDRSAVFHAQIGEAVARQNIDHLLCYGAETKATITAAQNAGFEAEHYNDKSALVESLRSLVTANDLIYLKGSRGMEMETVIVDLFGADAC